MNELNGHRSFTYTRRNALDRSMAHVADRENAGYVRFEKKRIPLKRPFLGTLIVPLNQIRPSENEPAIIALDRVAHPVGARQGTNEDEHRACGHAFHLVGIGAENRYFFQVSVAMDFGNAGVRP